MAIPNISSGILNYLPQITTPTQTGTTEKHQEERKKREEETSAFNPNFSKLLTDTNYPKVTLNPQYILTTINQLINKKDFSSAIKKINVYLNFPQLDMSTKIKLLTLQAKAKFGLGDMSALTDLKQALALQPSPEQKSNILFLQGAIHLLNNQKMDIFNATIDFTSAQNINPKVFPQNLKEDSCLSDDSKSLKTELLKFAEICQNNSSKNFKDLQKILEEVQSSIIKNPSILKSIIK